MKTKSKVAALAVAACAMVQMGAFADLDVSSGPVVPGEWNSHFYAGKAYAEANNVPMLLFWANPGCGNCEKMKKAVAKEDFVAWMKESGYVFVFVAGENTKEKSDAKDFAWNSARKYPYLSVYYNYNGWKKRNFSGLSGSMPSKVGSGLQGKLISSVEAIVSGDSGGGSGGIPDSWMRKRIVDLAVESVDGVCKGYAEVKLGKAKSSTGVSAVNAMVELLGVRKLKFSGKVTASDKPFTLSKSGYTLTLTANDSGVSGTLSGPAGSFTLRSVVFGGAVDVNCFTILNKPSSYGSNPILTEFLDDVWFTASGSKWTLPDAGTVKWSSAEKAFVASSAGNPASLKLKYKSSTGAFTGKFFVYAQTGDTKVKKLAAKVSGYVVDGVGSGVATCKGVANMWVEISKKR